MYIASIFRGICHYTFSR